jgi:hypothetical protein
VLGALAMMVFLLATGLVPPAVAGLLAAGIILVSGVLTTDQVYRGDQLDDGHPGRRMTPLSVAMQTTGPRRCWPTGWFRWWAMPGPMRCSPGFSSCRPSWGR